MKHEADLPMVMKVLNTEIWHIAVSHSKTSDNRDISSDAETLIDKEAAKFVQMAVDLKREEILKCASDLAYQSVQKEMAKNMPKGAG